MLGALEDDERLGRLGQVPPLPVGARHMGLQGPEP